MVMSVTRALVELKRLSSRIDSAIQSGKYVSRTVGKNQFRKVVGSSDSVEQMTAKIQGSFDQINALIENRQKIKSAIVISNATTTVTVMGRVMTVAEAIELKGTVASKKHYLEYMRAQFVRESSEVTKANVALDLVIETSMNQIYGSEKSKVDENTYKAVASPQKDQKEQALLDPCAVESKLDKLAEEINVLSSEIDLLLSESNARTTIDV